MQKVYVVIQEYMNEYDEVFTDIIHICNSLDLAVEKSNEFIQDAIRDYMNDFDGRFDFITKGRYFSKNELFSEDGVNYLEGKYNQEYHNLRIEEYEVRED
jgi:hypothetical protein